MKKMVAKNRPIIAPIVSSICAFFFGFVIDPIQYIYDFTGISAIVLLIATTLCSAFKKKFYP